jgi:hypothetical protein
MSYTPLPDVELVATSWLRNHESFAEFDATVSTDLPNPLNPNGNVTIVRIGGVPVESIWLDEAHIQVQAWAPTKELAHSLAATARAALLDMEGHRDEASVVTGVTDLSGLQYVPDTSEDPTIPRYVFGLAVYLHP